MALPPLWLPLNGPCAPAAPQILPTFVLPQTFYPQGWATLAPLPGQEQPFPAAWAPPVGAQPWAPQAPPPGMAPLSPLPPSAPKDPAHRHHLTPLSLLTFTVPPPLFPHSTFGTGGEASASPAERPCPRLPTKAHFQRLSHPLGPPLTFPPQKRVPSLVSSPVPPQHSSSPRGVPGHQLPRSLAHSRDGDHRGALGSAGALEAAPSPARLPFPPQGCRWPPAAAASIPRASTSSGPSPTRFHRPPSHSATAPLLPRALPCGVSGAVRPSRPRQPPAASRDNPWP
ncbi:PREDICTED: vegetative cell wall protein gp1-like [Calidris pugnax]|uniref:vegetative cell wall protein gp1-like n=1 Tax=Calidris pugnax TaxID=198806 RepID=UPI00071CEC56|nr:PREDICTED: vegetative cell wall protein gp1-like [Calidris pugnax]